MPQTRYQNQRPLGPGMDFLDAPGEKETLINQDPQAQQVDEVSVSGSGSSNQVYGFKVNGVEVTYDTSNGTTQDNIGQGLADAVNAENLINGSVSASYDSSTDTITLTERWAGSGGFTYQETQDPGSLLSQTRVTQAATAAQVPWGRALEKHGSLGDKLARLVDASNFTARDLQVTLDGSTDGDYRVKIMYHGGQVFVATYTASGDNIDTILNNLRDDINNNGPSLLSASVDTGPTPSELHITPETDGFADFDIIETDGPSQVDDSVAASGDDLNKKFGGVAVVNSYQTYDPGKEVGEYDANDEMDVRHSGALVAVPVEEQPSSGNDVYVRLSANGNLDRLGAFRASFNSGCVPLKGAEWERAPNSDVAVIKLP